MVVSKCHKCVDDKDDPTNPIGSKTTGSSIHIYECGCIVHFHSSRRNPFYFRYDRTFGKLSQKAWNISASTPLSPPAPHVECYAIPP